MKIDVEGADVICLRSLLDFEEKPLYVSAELLAPHNLQQKTDCLDVLSTLKVLG